MTPTSVGVIQGHGYIAGAFCRLFSIEGKLYDAFCMNDAYCMILMSLSPHAASTDVHLDLFDSSPHLRSRSLS